MPEHAFKTVGVIGETGIWWCMPGFTSARWAGGRVIWIWQGMLGLRLPNCRATFPACQQSLAWIQGISNCYLVDPSGVCMN